jgi:hypothetical protein
MDGNSAKRDPLPGSLVSIKEIVEFWDTHSTVGYEDEMETVNKRSPLNA